ncbi:MAG: DUF21 domain-containing protein [Kiritimatiellae bacterium]|nr:DUF21 domain-containing protein [Kiritimatiellia bacterium]
MIIPIHLIVILACLVAYAFFAGMEIGVISVHRLRLRHLVREEYPGARIIQDFLAHPDRLLGTTLVGTNLCMVAASISAAAWARQLLGPVGPTIAGALMTVIVLTCCEYLPKAWFRGDPAYRTIPFARLLWATGLVLYPLGRIFVGIVRHVFPVAPKPATAAEPFVTREELMLLTREGEMAGTLTPDERRMIGGVFDLRQRTCGRIMVPRGLMVTVHQDTPAEQILDLARARSVSRLPVYHDEEERFVGIVHVMDMLASEAIAGKTAEHFARPPQFAPADMPVDDLLPRMRMTRQPMALVTDEQSEVVGLVTSEDILEEIVGRLQ